MVIIHIVSSINSTNFGIWNAAIFASKYLKLRWAVKSELWICSKSINDTISPGIPFNYFKKSQLSIRGINRWLSNFDRSDTIIVSHGAWLKPTFIGYLAKRKGYQWVYLSHGMFEPWALKVGKLKKKIYFLLLEKRMCIKADIIRAVSKPEENNLKTLIRSDITLIRNGVSLPDLVLPEKSADELIFLFLARLHYKKGIVPLVKAWQSVMGGLSNVKLFIVGPDEGELPKIAPYLTGNVSYLGPLFGEEKKNMLLRAHFYLLPSFSEGFPTSVVEAMSYGAIPVISEGCNFPEVFEEGLGFQITPEEESICRVLKELGSVGFSHDLSKRNIKYVEQYLSEPIIGEMLYEMYCKMLSGKV